MSSSEHFSYRQIKNCNYLVFDKVSCIGSVIKLKANDKINYVAFSHGVNLGDYYNNVEDAARKIWTETRI